MQRKTYIEDELLTILEVNSKLRFLYFTNMTEHLYYEILRQLHFSRQLLGC